MKLDNCNALITGASAGIGREFARQLAGCARSMILVARRDERLIELADRCRALREWVRETSPQLDDDFAARIVAELPQILAREALARWLRGRGAPNEEVTPAVVQRLLTMCEDASSPPRAQFPCGITVRRRAGRITAQS